jgi:23S rRNA (cytosine1962-C5)-methyltransferase
LLYNVLQLGKGLLLKIIELSKDGAQKLLKGTKELYPRDLNESVKSAIPGEWIYLKNSKKEKYYLAFVNPLSINTPLAHIIGETEIQSKSDEEFMFELLDKSISKRNYYHGYENSCRLVYGNADELPGLIVDSYVNCIVIQINTAGIDRFRDKIKSYLEDKFSGKKVYLLDNIIYRERESLPVFQNEAIAEDLKIIENNLHLKVKKEKVQKVGYYYDHRENRDRATNLIKKLNREFKNGLDLFCYVGSWGLHFLKSDVKSVTFVDQAEMSENLSENLKLNDFGDRGKFVRSNVFDYIKEAKNRGERFDLICSDPPAFCKSRKEERKAYEGYLKLHKNIFELLERDGVFIACSCTHYINLESFQRNIEEAAFAKNRKIQLLDCGVQGFDHPSTNLNSKNSYLKYLAYRVE